MGMTTIEMTSANADAAARRLYETAFPAGEKIAWDDLLRLVEEMHLDFTAYYENGQLVGLTIVFPRPSFNWLWYFAVVDELREQGYGHRILSQLIERDPGQPCVVDMESPEQPSDNIEQRRRRHTFYLRNGFRDTNLYHSYNDITMTMMMRGPGTFTMRDWDESVSELKAHWWSKVIKEGD